MITERFTPKPPTWFQRNRMSICAGFTVFSVGLLIVSAFGLLKTKGPVNTQKEPEVEHKVEYIQSCVNGKRLLMVKGIWPAPSNSRSNWDGVNGFVWDVDMAGRPIICGDVQDIGPK